MFIDAREVEFGTVLQKDVCIVGAGIAGMTIARELDRLGIESCIVESGGFKWDQQTHDLGRAERAGAPTGAITGGRTRIVGGNIRFWDGFCRPLDELDFQKRDWVPSSGWPFGKTDLTKYYEQAATLLKLVPSHLDTACWLDELGQQEGQRVSFFSKRVVDTVSQYSPVKRVSREFLEHLRTSERITVLMNATAVEIETDSGARNVRRLDAVTLRGRKVFVSARLYVLAGGGIENARLLLTSNRVRPAGLGNGHGLVGRFFMDHTQVVSGGVQPSNTWTGHALYDDMAHVRTLASPGTRLTAQYSLSADVQKAEGLLNGLIWLSSDFGIDGTVIGESWLKVKRRLVHSHESPSDSILSDVGRLLAHPLVSTRLLVADWLKPQMLRKGFQFRAMVEPVPDPDNRVILSEDIDPLGMRRVRIDWRPPPLVNRTIDRSLSIVAEELERAGAARVKLDPRDWSNPCVLRASGHHMGTTRMHDSPTRGVVDRNGLVHGMHNLFVAGPSVFPTAGPHAPTMTVAALSLRLAEHLGKRMKSPTVSTRAGRP